MSLSTDSASTVRLEMLFRCSFVIASVPFVRPAPPAPPSRPSVHAPPARPVRRCAPMLPPTLAADALSVSRARWA